MNLHFYHDDALSKILVLHEDLAKYADNIGSKYYVTKLDVQSKFSCFEINFEDKLWFVGPGHENHIDCKLITTHLSSHTRRY
jgi:hypothetical protein